MKNTFLTLLALSLCSGAATLSGQQLDTIQKYYPDGRPAAWYTVLEGKAEGEWLEWFPDGTLRYRASWREGKGHGLWEYFHPNGQLRSQAVYENDLATGIYLEYFTSGQLSKKTVYLAGKKEGPQTTYRASGIIDRVEYFENDILQVRTPRIYAPGILSDPAADEYGIAFGPKMNSVYVTRRYAGEKQRIYRSHRKNGQWTVPEVASFSTNRDEGATLSADGQTLIFASFRSIGAPRDEEALMDMNLWVTQQTDDGWSTPVPLPGKVNRDRPAGTPWARGYETGPFLAGDKLYYWSAGTEGNDPDLMVALRNPEGVYGEGRELEGLNTDGSESGAAVSADGQYLVFSAYGREDGFGGEDLYLARWLNDRWSAPQNLGPGINTDLEEGAASFSPDGNYLFFTRGGEEVQTDIFYLSVNYLPGVR